MKLKDMYFLIKDDELLEKYKIWDKVINSIKKGFDTEPVYNEKNLKTKIKSYESNINTNFRDDRMTKKGSHCICLSVISVDFVFKMGKMSIICKCF